jgi:hypothetical protein
MENQEFKILLLEDNTNDAELAILVLPLTSTGSSSISVLNESIS